MKVKTCILGTILFSIHLITFSQTIEQYQKSFSDSWKPKSFSGFAKTTVAIPPSSVSTVTVTIDPTNEKAKVLETIFGVSTTWYGGNNPNSDPEAKRYYNALNSPAIRFPGGTPSDCYFWSAKSDTDFPSWYVKGSIAENGGKEVTPLNAEISWAFKLSDMYALLKANPEMNAVFQVNYSSAIYAYYGTSKTRAEKVLAAAQYAAAWVKDANITQGLHVKYWEVGNEIGRSWTPTGRNSDGSQHTVGGTEFAEDFVIFSREMKKVDPTIKVGACGDYQDSFTAQCLKVPGFVAACDWLGVHDYFGTWGTAHSEADLKGEADLVESQTANRYRQIFADAGLARDVIPLALTEWNTASVGNWSTLSQGGAIMHAKAVGKLIESGYGMVNMFAMSDVWRNKGDLGLLSNWSTTAPTEQGFPASYSYPNGTPSPVFYPYAYYRKTFGDKLIATTCSDNGVRVYSSKFTNAPYYTTVIINENNASKVVEIKGIANAQNYYYFEQLPVDTYNFFSTQITVNGVSNENKSFVGGPLHFEDIPPFSASATSGIKLALKPYGIYYVMIATEIPVLTRIAIEPITKTFMVGNPVQFELKYFDQRDNLMSYTTTIPQWNVSGGGTVDKNGLFTPTTKGDNYTLSATTVGPNGQLSAPTVSFNVDIPVLTSIVVDPATKTMGVNETFDFEAIGKDQNGNSLTTNPTWKVSGGGSITQTGTFTAQTIGGPYIITATANGKSVTATVTVSPGCPVNKVGAVIEAENFCKKSTAPKEEPCSDVNTGKNMGYIGDGDWISYWIDIPIEGSYKISYRVASQAGGGKIDLKDGTTSLGTIDISSTAGWQNWSTITQTVTLPVGVNEITVFATKGGFNLNWLKVESVYHLIPGKIEAESYVDMFGIQTQPTTDTGLGENVGYTDANDWLSYNVNILESGEYKVSYRVASSVTTGAIQLKIGNTDIITTSIENTGGWQTWITKTAIVPLTKGQNILKVNFTGGGVNLNWIEFERTVITSEQALNSFEKVNVYPNPASTNIYVNGENIESVALLTVDGTELANQVALITPLNIEVENIPNGLYLLKIQTKKEIITKKIIKNSK